MIIKEENNQANFDNYISQAQNNHADFDNYISEIVKDIITDSRYFINNFICGLSKEDIINSYPNWYDKNEIKFYKKIDLKHIKAITIFDIFLKSHKLNRDLVLYRGEKEFNQDFHSKKLICTSYHKMNAERFCDGVLLKLHLPKGFSGFIKADDILNEKYLEWLNELDGADEFILSPCDTEIISSSSEFKNAIYNKGKLLGQQETKIIDVNVKARNFILEVARALENPPEDYLKEFNSEKDKEDYQKAKIYVNQSLINNTFELINIDYFDKTFNIDYNICKINRPKAQEKTVMEKILDKLKEDIQKSNVEIDGTIFDTSKLKNFYNQIVNSKNFDVLEEFLTSDEHYQFYNKLNDGFHCIEHVDNVTLMAFYLANEKNLSKDLTRIVLEASRFHDIGRQIDISNHHIAGAELYKKFRNKAFSDAENDIISALIATHSLDSYFDVKSYIKSSLDYLKENDLVKLAYLAEFVRNADMLEHVRAGFYFGDFNSLMLTFQEARIDLVDVANYLAFNKEENLKQISQTTSQENIN